MAISWLLSSLGSPICLFLSVNIYTRVWWEQSSNKVIDLGLMVFYFRWQRVNQLLGLSNPSRSPGLKTAAGIKPIALWACCILCRIPSCWRYFQYYILQFQISSFGAGSHCLQICPGFFSPFTLSEGGHVRANCSFDLCVMPPTAVHSRDATRTEINSWEWSCGSCLETHQHKYALYALHVVIFE